MRKEILLTFDYELFLGSKSGTAESCMLLPTQRILKVLGECNAKAIFFVDTTYLWKLKKESNHNSKHIETYEKIKNQILEISQSHYVYLHIHPHWIDAEFDTDANQWNLSNADKFTVSNLSIEEREKILFECFEILRECSKQPIEGYRAGGLFIQPFSDIKPFFERTKIKYEFSVYKGFKSLHQNMQCDFTHAPDQHIYNFEDDVCEMKTNGSFTQYSISNFEMAGLNRIINSLYYRYMIRKPMSSAYGQGKGAQHVLANNEKHTSVLSTVHETFSVELMNLWKNKLYLNYLKSNHYLHFLSHPKLTSDMNLEALSHFLKKASEKYQLEFDFKRFKH
jgi:hypothetical protein